MTRRQFVLAVLCIGVVALAVAWAAGRQSMINREGSPPSLDAVRLGPDPGQPVARYLAALPARLPAATAVPVPALVQFGTELTAADAARLVAGTTARQAVFRVDLPRVQTALRFERLGPVDLPDPGAVVLRQLEVARQAAAQEAGRSVPDLAGRQADLARYEAAALAGECPCVLAVLVTGNRAELTALAARSGVRAVDAAPEGTPATGVALSPLLPEQTRTADPVPDDGPIPAVAGGGPAGSGISPGGGPAG